ncbi:MAG: hypothetical protein H0T89_24820 [Deltaproteobacteria bacterium]|nr:hypothetical protein [Deltaproteobacteria bacterium]MDQ3298080.1 hypothetical protein [Myxococcota bacterium]
MSRRRRAVFATPFVLVVGCGHPSERVVSTPGPMAIAAAKLADAGPGDTSSAVVDAPPDDTASIAAQGTTATMVDAGVPGSVAFTCADPETVHRPHYCNPPRPARTPIVAEAQRVIVLKPLEMRFRIRHAGEQQGVRFGWTGEFIDDDGKPIANTTFKIVQVTDLTADAVVPRLQKLPGRKVRLYPP